MAISENRSIGVFIDGGYYAKINEGLAKSGPYKVNLKGLLQFITEKLAEMDEIGRAHV